MLKKCQLIFKLLEHNKCSFSKELEPFIELGVVEARKSQVYIKDYDYLKRYFDRNCKDILDKYHLLSSKGYNPSNIEALEKAYKLYKYLDENLLLSSDIRHISVDIFGDSKTIQRSEILKKMLDDFLEKSGQSIDQSFNIIHIKSDKKASYKGLDLTEIFKVNGFFSCLSYDISKLDTEAKYIVTFENLSPFFRLTPKDSLFIYVCGFQNIYEVAKGLKFLKFKKIVHFGDVDPAGLMIADILLKEHPFATFYPDIDTIKALVNDFGKFSTAERDYDEHALSSNMLKEIANFMKSYGKIRIEQEAITSLILQVKINMPEWVNKKQV